MCSFFPSLILARFSLAIFLSSAHCIIHDIKENMTESLHFYPLSEFIAQCLNEVSYLTLLYELLAF